MFFGTGKPPWQQISDDNLSQTSGHINETGPKKVLPSAHDTCDRALGWLNHGLQAETTVLEITVLEATVLETTVLEAGRTYRL